MARTAHRRLPQLAAAALISSAVVAVLPAAALAQGTTAPTTGSQGTGQASAPACSASAFAAAQQKVETALSDRVTQLNKLLGAVDNSSNHLTPSDKTTLTNDISTVELPGIEALQPQVQSATTCAELRTDAHSMVYNFRVYIVMTPQTHLTIVLDDESYIIGQLTSLEPAIQQAINQAQQQGKNVTAAQTAFDDFEAQLSAASSSISGQSATVLAQTPQGAPGNWTVFLNTRTDATNARNDLHTARQDLDAIKRDLG